MELKTYLELVSNLPVRQQCFTTKRTTWKKAEDTIDWLSDINNRLFNGQDILNISRQDIFNKKDSLRELILMTIYWGYTSGMRGNHFVNILEKIDELEIALNELKQSDSLTKNDFCSFAKIMESIKGLGLSTYSKLLYFLEIKFDGSTCLILDQRLIDVFNNNTYEEYSDLGKINDYTKKDKYLPYLELTNQIATDLQTKGENIEQFLFMFGNNLKSD